MSDEAAAATTYKRKNAYTFFHIVEQSSERAAICGYFPKYTGWGEETPTRPRHEDLICRKCTSSERIKKLSSEELLLERRCASPTAQPDDSSRVETVDTSNASERPKTLARAVEVIETYPRVRTIALYQLSDDETDSWKRLFHEVEFYTSEHWKIALVTHGDDMRKAGSLIGVLLEAPTPELRTLYVSLKRFEQ